MAFKLTATHRPTGEVEEFGPWDDDPDPARAAHLMTFANGFVCGLFTKSHGVGFDPADLDVQLVVLPDANSIVGHLVAEASATVTHADGTVG